jgi:formate--tetrahydrofolate ligase
VALNRFYADTDAEIDAVRNFVKSYGVKFAVAEVFAKGGEGGVELARLVCETIETEKSHYTPLYDTKLTIKQKIEKIAVEIYRARDVSFSDAANKSIALIEALGYTETPVCIAKTQYSLSDDPKKLCAPRDFTLNVRDVTISAGAGFAVVLTGNIMTMPGLPKIPAAEKIDCDEDGIISGLF